MAANLLHQTNVKTGTCEEEVLRQVEEKYSPVQEKVGPRPGGYWIKSDSMRTASIRAQWEGRLVDGRFALLEWLGGSEDHAVFLTVLQGIQKAAIKLIPAEGAEADSYIAQWEAAKKLSHPDLIAVLETGRFAIAGTDLVYVVTEFAEKPLLQTIQTWALGAREARGFLDPVLDALAYLHGKGFVHGHVKPSNILMAADQWKLSGDDLLVGGEFPDLAWIPGGYDAPEAMNGSITPAMDAWSLGMTLTEALTQHPLVWDWSSNIEPAVQDGLPRPFDEIVRQCLRIDPAQRCSIEEIKSLLGGAGSLSESAPATPVRIAASRMNAEPMRSLAEPARPATRSKWAELGVIPPLEEPTRAAAQPKRIEPAPVPVRDFAPDQFQESVREPRAEERGGFATRREPEEPVDFDRVPTLFADYEEANRGGFPVLPWLIGVLVVLAAAGVFLVRSGKIPWPLWPQNAPTSSQSRPAPQSPSTSPSEGQTPPETGHAPSQQQPQGTSPAESATEPQTSQAAPGAQQPDQPGAAPEPQSRESAPTQAQSAPGTETAPLTGQSAPQQPSQKSSSESALATGKVPPEPHAVSRTNGEGAVAARVVPNLPEAARQSMHGPQEAVVQVFVDQNGSVSNAAFATSGPGNYFARTAIRAARDWKFDPPIRNGHPQPSVWTLRFHFTPGRTEVSAVQDRR
jgi:TonB family protein